MPRSNLSVAETCSSVALMESRALLAGVSYTANFLSVSEQTALDEALSSRPWKKLRDRTVQNWGGLPHVRGMVPVALPPFLSTLATRLATIGIFAQDAPPNHVLVNRYSPGQGILPHTDGPAYVPTAAIVSLRAPILFDFLALVDPRKEDSAERKRVASIWLEPGSLLVMKAAAYSEMHHAIADRHVDVLDGLVLNAGDAPPAGTRVPRKERVSLTLRRASKTLRNPLRLVKR